MKEVRLHYIYGKLIQQFISVGSLRIDINGFQSLHLKSKKTDIKTGQSVVIGLSNKKALRRMVFNPELAVGELYMDGDLWVIDGSLEDFIILVFDNRQYWEQHILGKLYRFLQKILGIFSTINRPKKSKQNVAHHYDLNDPLYDSFLDKWRQYSCAYFAESDKSPDKELNLEDAQEMKLARLGAKLNLKPGLSILDIGCGWGGHAHALHLFEPDIKTTGITLSENQLSYAQNHLSFPLPPNLSQPRFQLIDYRSMTNQFDRIISVGMLEHVGAQNFKTYFNKIASCLKPDGVAVIHTIASFGAPQLTNSWITKYIFPGGYLPSLSELNRAIESSGLVTTDIELMRLHYAKTLQCWRQRFMANQKEMIALFDARFVRMWEFYLLGSEYYFRSGKGMVVQIQLAHDQEAVPLTREYIRDKTETYVKRLCQTQNSGKQPNSQR